MSERGSVNAIDRPRRSALYLPASNAKAVAKARTLQDQLSPLHDAMFCEASPAPAKFGASVLGYCTDEVRLPLVPATEAARVLIRKAMAHAGIA